MNKEQEDTSPQNAVLLEGNILVFDNGETIYLDELKKELDINSKIDKVIANLTGLIQERKKDIDLCFELDNNIDSLEIIKAEIGCL